MAFFSSLSAVANDSTKPSPEVIELLRFFLGYSARWKKSFETRVSSFWNFISLFLMNGDSLDLDSSSSSNSSGIYLGT